MERKCIALLTQNTSNAAEYKSSLPYRVEGTCQWILSNPQYLEWNLQKESCLLWISGYPGSGKTILSAYILEYLAARELPPNLRTTLCYFFCDEKIDTQRDGKTILRSLIHQLLVRRQSLIRYVKSAYDVQGPQFDQSFDQLWRIFVAVASDKRVGPINVIVDAIDECEQETREQFLQHVEKLVGNSRSSGLTTPCIKFLVTSRPLLGCDRYTTNIPPIELSQHHVEQDLKLVIQNKVEGIVQRTRCKPDVKAYLEHALYSKADRTFLWVTLVLRLLEQSFLASRKDFRLIVDELPRTLTATYESFLHEISEEYQPLATRLLHFLVGSSRILTLEEMRILLAMQDHHRTLAAIEEDAQPNIRETIEGVLGPLVRIWDSGVYLLHQSLKEYLQDLSTRTEDPFSAIYGVDPYKANLLLAKACVSYLLLDDFKQDLLRRDQSDTEDSPISPVAFSTVESIEQLWGLFDVGETTLFQDIQVWESDTYRSIGNQYAFFDYSARYWAEHFSSACSISPPELQKPILLLSDTSSSQGLNWFRYYWSHATTNSLYPRDFVPIITASYFGHLASLRALLREGLSLESEIGTRALYWASRMGHHDAVDLLLKNKADPDVEVVEGQTALITAIEFNRLAVVKRLLKDEGFISEEEGYRVNKTSRSQSPLLFAARYGLVEIVGQLLQHSRIQPDIADQYQQTPLFWAIKENHLDVLQLLIADNRVCVNHVDFSGRNLLSWAASRGNLELVRYLMGLKHLKADIPDRRGQNALFYAATYGHLEVTAYLRRSRRLDMFRRDEDGRNVLWWACIGYHPTVVQYLIKHDPQGVDLEDVGGWTPLAWVSYRGAPKVVQVLLDSGLVDVNRKDRNGRSALSLAAGRGHLDVVEILLDTQGIDIDSKDNDERAALSYAMGYPDIVARISGLSR